MQCKWQFWSIVAMGLSVGVSRADIDKRIEVEGRGPLHESFAQPWEKNPAPNEAVQKEPPPAVPEEPPEERPEGTNVQWIPGYWQWDGERNDFIWISGCWRDVPNGRRWVMGYWTQTDDGWVWVNGHWAAEQEQDEQIVPPPPDNPDEGPSTPQPDEDSFYIPGSWFYTQSGYRYRPGYWAGCRPGFVWNPARYFWSPRGWLFSNGFWDYDPYRRGLLFAPVYFPGRFYLGAGFAYRPFFAIRTPLLFTSLFLRPGWGHYYYGDFYGQRYAGLGFRPWIGFGVGFGGGVGLGFGRGLGFGGGFGYDPLFSYARWSNRSNPQWYNNLRTLNDDRIAGRVAPPPRTLADQVKLGANAKSQASLAGLDQLRQSGVKLEKINTTARQSQIQNVQKLVSQSKERGTLASQARVSGTAIPRSGPNSGVNLNTGAGVRSGATVNQPRNLNQPNTGGNWIPQGNTIPKVDLPKGQPNPGGNRLPQGGNVPKVDIPKIQPNPGGNRGQQGGLPKIEVPRGGNQPKIEAPRGGGSVPRNIVPSGGGGSIPRNIVPSGGGGSIPRNIVPSGGGGSVPRNIVPSGGGGSVPRNIVPSGGGGRPSISPPSGGGRPFGGGGGGGGRPIGGGGGGGKGGGKR